MVTASEHLPKLVKSLMGREAAFAVDLNESLHEQAVSRVECGVVVASEQTERHEAHRRVEVFGEYPLRHAREAFLGAREGNEHVREHRGGASCAEGTRRAQDVERGLLSGTLGEVAGVESAQERGKFAGEEACGFVDAARGRIGGTHVRRAPWNARRHAEVGRAGKRGGGGAGGGRQFAPR